MEKQNKVSESQRKATKNWEQNNKEHANYLKGRSACKSFIRNKSTLDDLQQIEELIKSRREELSSS